MDRMILTRSTDSAYCGQASLGESEAAKENARFEFQIGHSNNFALSKMQPLHHSAKRTFKRPSTTLRFALDEGFYK
jgi:hypothetical protein